MPTRPDETRARSGDHPGTLEHLYHEAPKARRIGPRRRGVLMKLTTPTIERLTTVMLFIQMILLAGILSWMSTRFSVSPEDLMDRIDEFDAEITALIEADLNTRVCRTEINQLIQLNDLKTNPN